MTSTKFLVIFVLFIAFLSLSDQKGGRGGGSRGGGSRSSSSRSSSSSSRSSSRTSSSSSSRNSNNRNTNSGASYSKSNTKTNYNTYNKPRINAPVYKSTAWYRQRDQGVRNYDNFAKGAAMGYLMGSSRRRYYYVPHHWHYGGNKNFGPTVCKGKIEQYMLYKKTHALENVANKTVNETMEMAAEFNFTKTSDNDDLFASLGRKVEIFWKCKDSESCCLNSCCTISSNYNTGGNYNSGSSNSNYEHNKKRNSPLGFIFFGIIVLSIIACCACCCICGKQKSNVALKVTPPGQVILPPPANGQMGCPPVYQTACGAVAYVSPGSAYPGLAAQQQGMSPGSELPAYQDMVAAAQGYPTAYMQQSAYQPAAMVAQPTAGYPTQGYAQTEEPPPPYNEVANKQKS